MSKLISGFFWIFRIILYLSMDILKIFQMQEPVSKLLLRKKKSFCQNKDELQENFKIATINNLQPIGEIFRMQEPVSKDLLVKKDDLGQYKEVLQEKDVLIKNNTAKIKELEAEIIELKQTNQTMEIKLKASSLDDNSFEEVMLSYDDFFKKLWKEREEILIRNEVMDEYLQNLECSYNDLLEKFQKAKEIIYGLKNNQDMLKGELEEYREVVEMWEKKYDDLKEHSETTIAEANMELGTKKKENLQEVAKLKSNIIQRQTKIKELENMLKNEMKPSIYAPLRNKIKSK